MKLHLGCGERYLKGYVNIDFPASSHTVQEKTIADQKSDIQKLKYPANSIKEIRLHHVFEHFPRNTACALLTAWNNWLENDGLLRIEVPDFSKMAISILNLQSSDRKKFVAQRHIFGSQEAGWATHFAGYTKESLTELLEMYGFNIIKIKNNSWRKTANIEIFAVKNNQNISLNEFEKITNKYLSKFSIDTSTSEQRMFSVWMNSYRLQVNKMIRVNKRDGISVIIPTYNNAGTIKKAINSCISQSIKPIEILVCDDGSRDNTKVVVKSIGSPLVKWIDGKINSGGPATPRNRGIKIAQGEWIAFLDADDEWTPNKLNVQFTAAKKTKCLAVCTNAYRKIDDRKKILYFDFSDKKLKLSDLLITNLVICSSMFLHYSVLEETGGFPIDPKLISVEDYTLWLRVAVKTDIFYLKKPLVIYNDNSETSIRSKANRNPVLAKCRVLINFYKYLAL